MDDDIAFAGRVPVSVQDALAERDDNRFSIALSNLLFAREAAVGYAGLTPEEQVIFCLNGLEREVNNGGFDPFYRNSAGDHALATPAALKTLGARRVAKLVEKANAVFPGAHPSSEQAEREAQLDALPEKAVATLEELQDTFYTYPDPLAKLARAFVKAHQGSFPPPPNPGGSVLD